MESPKDGAVDLSWWDWFTNIVTTDPVAVCTLIVSAIAFFCLAWRRDYPSKLYSLSTNQHTTIILKSVTESKQSRGNQSGGGADNSSSSQSGDKGSDGKS